jgi:hypothetical protein
MSRASGRRRRSGPDCEASSTRGRSEISRRWCVHGLLNDPSRRGRGCGWVRAARRPRRSSGGDARTPLDLVVEGVAEVYATEFVARSLVDRLRLWLDPQGRIVVHAVSDDLGDLLRGRVEMPASVVAVRVQTEDSGGEFAGLRCGRAVAGAGISSGRVSELALRLDSDGSGSGVTPSKGRGSAQAGGSHILDREALSGAGSGRRSVVFVDEATQDVGALDNSTVIGVAVPAAGRWGCRDVEVQSSVRTPTVVMGHVRAENLP